MTDCKTQQNKKSGMLAIMYVKLQRSLMVMFMIVFVILAFKESEIIEDDCGY